MMHEPSSRRHARMLRTRIAQLALLFAFAGSAHAAELQPAPCDPIPGLPKEARCGTFEVWENRAVKSGRKIPLRVVVIPATGTAAERLLDPITYFEGGPGQSAITAASWLLEQVTPLRRRRDILLVDFRGTGRSAGLFCPELAGSGMQGFLDDFYPPAKVKACAERLRRTIDLSQYTNDSSVDDVEEVRAALGYGPLNIIGASGGTRAAEVFLRRHPHSVRTMTLMGVLPMDERGPLWLARHAQRALDGLVAECASDAGCHAAFPNLAADVSTVLARVEREPVPVTLSDVSTGAPIELRIGRNGLAQILRYLLYNAGAASQLPLDVHLAAQGEWRLLAENARRLAGHGGTALADGYYLSLTCAEDVPFLTETEVADAARGTFLGDFRIRAQQAACKEWPVRPVDRSFLQPVASDVPVLLTSGERDPATPPGNAEKAARTLRNSRHVVVPDAGHIYAGVAGASECVATLIAELIDSASVQGLDASCLERAHRADFDLKWEPDIELPPEQLATFAGSYRDADSGYELRVTLVGKRLQAEEVGEEVTYVLVPTSPTRFRIEGRSDAMVFEMANGQPTALLFESPGQPPFRVPRIAAAPR